VAFSWNSELPSGHNPFWIRDEALAGVGLHAGDAVAVDTQADPLHGDLVVAEVELDGDSARLARRYALDGESVRLEAVGADFEPLIVDATALIVMGVIVARVRFDGEHSTEEPL
jgi:SOS-response transcriptional repressor LexA